MDPNFIGINITNGDLGSYAYLVHVDFDVFQYGSTRTYTLYVFRGSSANPGGVAYPNQSAGKVTGTTGQSGEWGASWIVSPPAPGLGTNNAIRVNSQPMRIMSCSFKGADSGLSVWRVNNVSWRGVLVVLRGLALASVKRRRGNGANCLPRRDVVIGFERRDLHLVRSRVEPEFESADVTAIVPVRIGMGVGGIVSDLRPARGTTPWHG
jgi:hypothetical protein